MNNREKTATTLVHSVNAHTRIRLDEMDKPGTYIISFWNDKPLANGLHTVAIPAVEALIDTLKGDEKTGAMIIAKALQAPIRQIAENAGVDGSVIFEKIRNSGKVGYGYNAYTEEYCDMIPSGIVDPTKVTRSALENAASICACVLTTESLVTDKPDPAGDAAKAAAAANAAGMGGMY